MEVLVAYDILPASAELDFPEAIFCICEGQGWCHTLTSGEGASWLGWLLSSQRAPRVAAPSLPHATARQRAAVHQHARTLPGVAEWSTLLSQGKILIDSIVVKEGARDSCLQFSSGLYSSPRREKEQVLQRSTQVRRYSS